MIRNINKILCFISFSLLLSTQVDISREYIITDCTDEGISESLNGYLNFQACDSSACIPIFQDISYKIRCFDRMSGTTYSFLPSSITIEDLPGLPDWGSFEIGGFDRQNANIGDTINYLVSFSINPGYHIFTTDTLLSPNGSGNTDIYWEELENFVIEELAYSEPEPYVQYNKTFKQNIGWHKGVEPKQIIEKTPSDTNPQSQIDLEEDKVVKQASSEEIVIEESSSKETPSNQNSNKQDNSKQESLAGFFIGAFLAGLLAVFTPCVFPMIPLTVSFFTKKGEDDSSQSKGGPLLYGLSIIIIFIILGLGFSFVLGADALNALATSPTANFIFFVIFFLFALSFFGAFDITLPNSFLNKINKKADQGGSIGIFFMAFTLVLITFSCTAPIVGSVLILSAEGEFIKPIVGMFGFSLSFALIFTLTALFPSSLENLPKGINLNFIKVSLGFIELAFSLKFLSKADLISQWGLLNRELFLAIWIVIFLLFGLYLLGKIKLYHDVDDDKIGVFRLMMAIASFSFVIAIFPGMFGAPLSWLSGYLPPPSTQEFDIDNRFNELESASSSAYLNFPDEVKYQNVDKIHTPLGLKGFFDYDEALEFAKNIETEKPIFLDFTGLACENCREMEHRVWSKPHIKKMLREQFIIVSLYVDHPYAIDEEDWITDKKGRVQKTIGKKNISIEIDKYENSAQPLYVVIDSDENILSEPIGKCNEKDFYKFLKTGLSNFHKTKGD